MLGFSKSGAVSNQRSFSAADFPIGTQVDLSQFAGRAIWIGTYPCVAFWGYCDTPGASITFVLAMYDERRNLIGTSLALGLDADPVTINGAGKYVGAYPGSVDVNSAVYVYPVIRNVTNGTWNLSWRAYGDVTGTLP